MTLQSLENLGFSALKEKVSPVCKALQEAVYALEGHEYTLESGGVVKAYGHTLLAGVHKEINKLQDMPDMAFEFGVADMKNVMSVGLRGYIHTGFLGVHRVYDHRDGLELLKYLESFVFPAAERLCPEALEALRTA